MRGTTYKRCHCRNPETGKVFGQACRKLRRTDGSWNPSHGSWQSQIDLPARANGSRRMVRRGGFASQTEADASLAPIRDALAVPDPGDTPALTRIGDLIENAAKKGEAVPPAAQIRRLLRLDYTADAIPTTGDWLDQWLASRKALRPATLRSYTFHVKLYLKPHLGAIRLDKLRMAHVAGVFDAIEERNELVRTLRTSRDPKKRDLVKGKRVIGASTMHLIRATIRAALNGAIRAGIIDHNPARLLELPTAKKPKALVWTDERVKHYDRTGQIPSKVMVWTPAHTGAFLDHVQNANDRLYALYHLVALRGLRRGEACGLHWTDLDLDAKTVTIRWQITQLGYTTRLDQPKTDSSEAAVALDNDTVAELRLHRVRQWRERTTAGSAWIETGLVFTTPIGDQLHPADVTDHFKLLRTQAGLPPIRLHDLRHGAATIALAAGVEMKIVQETLRHSSITVTADIYGSVLPELAQAAAEKTAAIIPRASTNRAAS